MSKGLKEPKSLTATMEERFAEAIKAQDQEAAEKIKRVLADLAAGFQDQINETFGPQYLKPAEAQEIMGKGFYFGPEALEGTWGEKLAPEQVPAIPFTQEDLKRARELGQMLILRVSNAKDGKPLSMRKMQTELKGRFVEEDKGKVFYDEAGWKADEEFFTGDAPNVEWQLATKGIIPGSTSKDYAKRLQALADYVRKVFAGVKMPENYQAAIDEFDAQKEELGPMQYTEKYEAAVRRLSVLKLAQFFCRTPDKELHDMLVVFDNTGERINENTIVGTPRLSSRGHLVSVGGFDRSGAHVSDWLPNLASHNIGVSFSRSR